MPSSDSSSESLFDIDHRKPIYDQILPLAPRRTLAKDASCMICRRSLEADEPQEIPPCTSYHRPFPPGPRLESPSKFQCGHLIGAECAAKLLSTRDRWTACPGCHASILDAREVRDARFWLDQLKASPPQQVIGEEPLTGKDLQWAERADELWKTFCNDMVLSLKDIDGPADWLSGRGKVTRMVLKFVTVERFSEVRRAEELFRSRVWDKWPQSYHTLCAHLDAPEHGSFLTPDHDTFLWQNACHLEIMEAYQGLVNRYASANNL